MDDLEETVPSNIHHTAGDGVAMETINGDASGVMNVGSSTLNSVNIV